MRGSRRAALYLRVSTAEQTVENQRPDLEQLARARRCTVVQTFEENASAWSKRPAFDAMMKAAHRGAFDLVLVWSLDRFGRSMAGNVNAVLELDRKGVEVVSVRETWLDTTGPTRSLLVAIMSWVAEQERIRLGERTRAGLERARRQGKSVGRPAKRIDWNAVDMLARKRYSVAEIAKALGVGRSTLLRAAAARRRDESRKGGVPEGGRSP